MSVTAVAVSGRVTVPLIFATPNTSRVTPLVVETPSTAANATVTLPSLPSVAVAR